MTSDVTALADGSRVPEARSAVVCAGLTYRFGTHTAVDHVDLRIEQGQTFGLLGPNGAGKTTTIRMITTLLRPMEGVVSVFGINAAAEPMRVRRSIGYVPQLLSADATLTGRENVELFARLFDVPRRQRAERVDGGAGGDGPDRAGRAAGEDLLGRHDPAAGAGSGAGQRAAAAGA